MGGADLLVINGLIKCSEPGHSPFPGFVAVKSGLIREIGGMQQLNGIAMRSARKVVDASGCLVMPGLVNGHNHCAMTLFRGLADDLPLLDWLQKHIFPAESKFVAPEMVYWCTKLAAAEMIRSGTTTVADSYFYEEYAARALKEAGIRTVAAQGVIDFPAPGVPDPAKNLQVSAAFIKEWQGDRLVTPAIFCHSPYTCNPETILAAKQLARQEGVNFFIHLAETSWEVEETRRLYGVTPLQHLHRLGVLDEQTVCVHAVWLDAEDLQLLGDSGASVVTCPESNMKLASGVAPVAQMMTAGISVGLGTDGSASNNDLDLISEMRSLSLLHKLSGQNSTVLPASEVYRMATIGGAGVLGMGAEIGDLAQGKKADLVLVDLDNPRLTPCYDHDSLLVYSASGGDVKSVIIDGKMVMEDHRLLGIDLEETMRQVNQLAARVKESF